MAQSLETGGLLLTHARFPAGCLLDRHTHDRAVLAVMIEGSFDLTLGSRSKACPPGTVFTEPAGESHSNLVGNAGARVAVIQPHPEHEMPRACSLLFDGANHFVDGRIGSLARRMVRELRAGDDLATLGAQGLALEMITLATRHGRDAAERSGAAAWLPRLEDAVHDRFLEGVRIEDLAREAGVHPAHFAREFRKRYGVPVASYVRGLRLDWAADRLARTDEALSTIAYRAGFSDQSHFTRAFRKHTGMPPGRYRHLRRTRHR